MTEQPGSYDAVLGRRAPSHQIQAKLRIERETKEDIDKIFQRLRQVFAVVEESHDYPKRRDSGMRRYLTVRCCGLQT